MKEIFMLTLVIFCGFVSVGKPEQCVEDLLTSTRIKRYRISDDCENDFFCTIACTPVGSLPSIAAKTKDIKVSVDAKLSNKLHITKTENEIKIELNTEVPNVSVVNDVPSSTEGIPKTTNVPQTNSTVSFRKMKQRPKTPCPCATSRSKGNSTTTTSTSSTTTTSTTELSSMSKTTEKPCPCRPHKKKPTTPRPTTSTVPTTQELTIRRSSIYETPEAQIETTTEQEFNCTTTDETTTNEGITTQKF